MATHELQNYRLNEGKLVEDSTEAQLLEAVEAILAAPKRSTYQYAFLITLITLAAESTRTKFQLTEVFCRFTAMYWTFLSRYPLRQIHRHALYELSSAEQIISNFVDKYPDVKNMSLSELPIEYRIELCDAMQRSCSRSVIGAAYGNSRGVLFGFSKVNNTLVLSTSSRAFLTANRRCISYKIEWAWLSMVKQLNQNTFPEALELRLRALPSEATMPTMKEELAMPDVIPPIEAQLQGVSGELCDIQQYIVKAKSFLDQKHVELDEMATRIKVELSSALKKFGKDRLVIQSRVKDSDSLAEKIYRKNYFNRYQDPHALIKDLPDLIGARIICLLNYHEEEVFQQLRAIYCESLYLDEKEYFFRPEEERLLFDFSNQPQQQKNGQPIYRISCKWRYDPNAYVNCELQIKSMVHFFWGELDHMLFYKNYSYLISQSFYNQYMLKIENALSNIDEQLGLLHDQINKDGVKANREIREIASLVLYRHYHEDMERQLGCPIDLREVFDLMVDMYFRNYGDQEANIQKLSDLIHNISAHSFCSNLLNDTIGSKVVRTDFSELHYELAKIIDAAVKKMDVYWIFFIACYGSHFVDAGGREYNFILGEVSNYLMRMIMGGFADSIERNFDELDELYEQFKTAIARGILRSFAQNPKLDFFILSAKLNRINKLSEGIAQKLQRRLTEKNAEDCSANMDVVTFYTHCKISAALYDCVPCETLGRLMELLKNDDPFALEPNLEDFDDEIIVGEDCSGQVFNALFTGGGA